MALSFTLNTLGHQGVAAKVIIPTFFCFVIGILFYFLDLIKNKPTKSN